MPRNASSSRFAGPRGALAWCSVLAVGLLVACAETSLNEAPIIDLSTPPNPSAAPVQNASQGAGGLAGSQAEASWYTVQKGDTLYHLSVAFHCSVQDLARWNGIAENAPLTVGERLRVSAPGAAGGGGNTLVAPATSTSAEAAEPVPAEVHAVPAPTVVAVEGQSLDSTQPSTGAAPEAPAVAPLASNAPLGTAQEATRPGSSAPATSLQKPAATEPAAPPTASVAERPVAASVPWIWPVDGKVTGTFDPVHTKGIEITTGEGAKILAVADGEVSYTGAPRDYGNLVIVKHPDGLLSVYAHAKSILVTQAQAVKRGQAIATAGKTDGPAPIVHFEVRRKGVPIDPLELLPAR